MINAPANPSSDGSSPCSRRNGAAIRVARSRGVTIRRLAQSWPSRAMRSASVRPTACEGTMTHFARVG